MVIPAFNAEATIDDQLLALSTQSTGRSFEVIVVDNGSSDDTAAKALAWEPSFDCLRVVSQLVPGAAPSRNAGARVAEAPIIAFCDADDVVDPGWIDGLVEALAGADAVFGPLDVDQLNTAEARAWSRTFSPSGLMEWNGFLPWGATANSAIRTGALWAVGGFDEGFPAAAGEDVALAWVLQLEGFRVRAAPTARVHYRLRSEARAAIRQSRAYAGAEVALHQRFGQYGMPRRSLLDACRGWGWLLKHISMIGDAPVSRTLWRRTLAKNVGRLEGSIRHRHWYP